jgi:hypothetical protein
MRRRVAWLLGFGLIVAAVAATFTLLSGQSGSSGKDEQLSRTNYAAPKQPKARRLTPADRRTIDATLDTFVRHAVRRHDVAAAYGTVTAQLRGGMTRREWSRGSIGVYPYPALGRRFHGWTVDESTVDGAWIQLLLHPRGGATVGPILFDVSLKRRHGKWLVDSFLPAATFAPTNKRPRVTAAADFMPGNGFPYSKKAKVSTPHTGQAVAVIPFAVLGALLLGLLGWGIFAIYRDRRIRRAHAATKLPPLPRLSMRGDDTRARTAHRP